MDIVSETETKIVCRLHYGDGHDEDFALRKVHDADMALAYPDSYPDDLRRKLEDSGWECVPRTEAREARVRRPADIETNVTIPDSNRVYYLQHPPEDHYTGFAADVAAQLASKRGVDPDEVIGAWYFPLRRRVEIRHETKVADTTHESLAVFEATEDEHERILNHASDDQTAEDSHNRLTHEELTERIHANSSCYPREAEITAAMARGTYMWSRIAAECADDSVTTNSVSKSFYGYRDRCEAVAWEIRHIWPVFPDEHITDEMQELIDAVDTANPETPLYLVEDSG